MSPKIRNGFQRRVRHFAFQRGSTVGEVVAAPYGNKRNSNSHGGCHQRFRKARHDIGERRGLQPRGPHKRIRDTENSAEQPNERGRGRDGGESTNPKFQIGSEPPPTALERSLDDIHDFSAGELRRSASEGDQTGADYGRHVAPTVARSDGNDFLKPAFAQGGGGFTNESAGLAAGRVVPGESVADDDQRVGQHQCE